MPAIAITDKCNNHCLMCTNPHPGGWNQDFLFESITNRIKNFALGQDEFLDNFRDSFVLSGGEPTLSSDLVKFIKYMHCYQPGMRIKCLTNGRRFFYADYAKRILDIPVNLDLIIPLHSIQAKIHDAITQVPGSFYQTVKGLENIFSHKKERHTVEIRWVIHGMNYQEIPEMANFVFKMFPQVERTIFLFFEIEGYAIENLQKLKLTYTEVAPYLKKLSKRLFSRLNIQLYHFPLCVIPTEFYPYVWRTLPSYEVDFLETCKKCSLKEFCLGVHRAYLQFVGRGEFKPKFNKYKIIKTGNWHHPIQKIHKL